MAAFVLFSAGIVIAPVNLYAAVPDSGTSGIGMVCFLWYARAYGIEFVLV
jgi:hypothetical protein